MELTLKYIQPKKIIKAHFGDDESIRVDEVETIDDGGVLLTATFHSWVALASWLRDMNIGTLFECRVTRVDPGEDLEHMELIAFRRDPNDDIVTFPNVQLSEAMAKLFAFNGHDLSDDDDRDWAEGLDPP